MPKPKVTVALFGMQEWFGRDYRAVVDLVKLAEDHGVDQVSIGDHVVIGEDHTGYPFGSFIDDNHWPWPEPLTLMATVAGLTSRISLSVGVLVSPLRPAVFLAKQLATLDNLSRGRVEVGFSVGWHRAEYEASGVPFEKRGEIFDEQLQVCKLLWREVPASFHGRHVSFDRIHCVPQPKKKNIPIWLGVPPTEKNFRRMVDWADGWVPLGITVPQIAEGVQRLKRDYEKKGRDPATLSVRSTILPPEVYGVNDIDATLATAPALVEAGITHLEIYPGMFAKGPEDLPRIFDKLVGLKG